MTRFRCTWATGLVILEQGGLGSDWRPTRRDILCAYPSSTASCHCYVQDVDVKAGDSNIVLCKAVKVQALAWRQVVPCRRQPPGFPDSGGQGLMAPLTDACFNRPYLFDSDHPLKRTSAGSIALSYWQHSTAQHAAAPDHDHRIPIRCKVPVPLGVAGTECNADPGRLHHVPCHNLAFEAQALLIACGTLCPVTQQNL